jgi:hypothetical protein
LAEGAAVWTYYSPIDDADIYGLEFAVRVQDLDGVPENIAAVSVTFPDGSTQLQLRHVEQISATDGLYFGLVLYDDPLSIPGGTYTFNVLDRDGSPGAAVQDNLTVDTLAVPNGFNLKNNSTVYGTTPTIDWGDIAGAEKYRLRVYDGWSGASLYYSDFLTASSHTLPDGVLDMDRAYRYRVYAYGENVPGADLDNYATSDTIIINRWLTTSAYIYLSPGGTCDGNLPCHGDLPAAIDEAAEFAILQLAEGTYGGDVLLDENKKIVIEGGYNGIYDYSPGKYARLEGVLTIAKGEVTAGNLVIQ